MDETYRWQELRTRLKSQPWHILHYVGHGGFDEDAQSGYLELTADDGNALRVEAGDLARLITHNSQLKLVVINACESATAGADGVFSSTAAKLMRAGVPAVVAMQYEITDPAALVFACSFYDAGCGSSSGSSLSAAGGTSRKKSNAASLLASPNPQHLAQRRAERS